MQIMFLQIFFALIYICVYMVTDPLPIYQNTFVHIGTEAKIVSVSCLLMHLQWVDKHILGSQNYSTPCQ